VSGAAGGAVGRVPPARNVAVLGATGSIGRSTLDVLGRHRDRYRVQALAAHRDVDGMFALACEHAPEVVAMTDADAAGALAARLRAAGCGCRVTAGPDALAAVAADAANDTVMAAVVGAAGLQSTLAAAGAGKRVLLANKEALVVGGELLLAACRASGAVLLPVDSEHNAVFQCLPASGHGGVRRIVLTASGGPFRTATLATMREATPEMACAHPNWRMGRKISVDSATMMNKGLELIEAALLFSLPPSRIDVVVHPQSVVHSLVEYVDGSVLAQLGEPDMRTPIAHALAWPERVEAGVAPLDLVGRGCLTFEAADHGRFRCLGLARAAAVAGGRAPACLNAANEEAVAAFLARRVGFLDIADIIAATLDTLPPGADVSLSGVLEADRLARATARQLIRDWSV
jgi:1-deoxy-D-xylulose-5-phosphate reductoisomerase